MDINYDSNLSIIFVDVGQKQITSDSVSRDLNQLEELLNSAKNAESELSLIVQITSLQPSILLSLPTILSNVVSFSGRNKQTIESVIDCAYLVTENQIGKKFFELLLQKRQSTVPVRICSSHEEAAQLHLMDHSD